MKTKITLLLLTFFSLVGNLYSQTDIDPDKIGGPVLIGEVPQFILHNGVNSKVAKGRSPLVRTAMTLADPGSLEWPNPGAVRIDKSATVTNSPGKWKINLKVEGKNIPKTTDVVLVIDDSGSMSDNGKITSAKNAAKTFVNELLTNSIGIRIAVVTINSPSNSGTPQVDQSFTNDTQTLNTSINAIDANGGTNIQGGFYAARLLMGTSTADKKVVILLSDGDPTYSYQTTGLVTPAGPSCSGNNWNITRPNFEAGMTVTSSNYGNIVGTGNTFNYALYSKPSSWFTCGTFVAGNHGMPTKYEAGLLMNQPVGADVYTIGFEIDAGGSGEKTLQASQNKGYFPATTSNISSIYSQIRNNIAYAATNAILTDPMSTYIVLESASTPTYSVLPSTIGNVVLSKGTATFSNNGYVLNDPDNPASGNSSIIKWKITWNIGTVSESGDNMYYFVTMAPNTDPTILYDANEKTYMDYTDVNGNTTAHQETPTNFTIPKVSGGKGSIEIIYYAVNEAGQPVNSAGVVVPRENALKLIPGNSKYFIYNNSTALEVNQNYTIVPESPYTSSGLNYLLHCNFGNQSVTPTPTTPNQLVWFGYKVNTPPTVSLVQPTCEKATGQITVTAPPTGNGTSYTVTGTNPVIAAVTNQSGVFVNLTPGTYSITVKSASGCILSSSAGVTINTQPVTPAAPTATVTDPTCALATGTITVTAPANASGISYTVTGTSPIVAPITNTTGIFAGLTAGTYNVTTTNAVGCISLPVSKVIATQPVTPAAPTATVTNVSCNGAADGMITVSGVSAGATTTIKLNNTGADLSNQTKFAPGTYTVTATNGSCSATAQVTITEPAIAVAVSGIATNVSCFGEANGSIALTNSAGSTVVITNAANEVVSNTNLPAGIYTLTATAPNGNATGSCSATAQVTITEPAAAITSVAIVTNNSNCVGCSNGTITQTVSGGTSPYTYLWSNGATTKDLTNLTKGTYSVEIKDQNGCTGNYTYAVTESGIALVKTAAVGGTGKVGDVITYTFAVTNTGNTSLTNVVVTDPMVGLTITGNPIATLAVGASNATIKGTYTITQADIDAGKVVNTALATAQDPKGNDVTDISGTSVDNNTPTDTPLTQKGSIVLVKKGVFADTNNDGFAQAGEKINYSFTVTNTGNVTVTNIAIADPMPGLTITNSPIASLLAGANATVTGTYILTQADVDAGKVTNSALATGKDPNGKDVKDISGTTVENDTPTTTPLVQSAKLEVVKTASTDGYSLAGDVISYTIEVKNTGTVTLYQILVTDPLTGLSTTIASLAPGRSQLFNENYTITKIDLVNNTVSNTATANGFTPNNTSISASDSVDVEKSLVLGCGTILVHNAFSPNGDGINDVFTIDNIGDTSCYPENTVEIYNRWGVLVFETKNYNNQSNNFEGISRGRTTISQSTGLPTGTYFYILNYTSVDGNGDIQTNKKDGYLYLTK